jgi:hypothetical protein
MPSSTAFLFLAVLLAIVTAGLLVVAVQPELLRTSALW